MLQTLLRTYIFLIPLTVLVLCEITKVGIEWARTGRWHEKLFHPGGMPSTHAAFAMSLLIVVWRIAGVHSVPFAIAFCFACYVWYDAFGPRHELGAQAHLLNQLNRKAHLQEHWGHSLKQVLAGIAFGALVTTIGMRLA